MNEYGCLNTISCPPPAASTSIELRMSGLAKSRRRKSFSVLHPPFLLIAGPPHKGICLPRAQGAVMLQQISRAQPLGPASIPLSYPFSNHVPYSSATDICRSWFYRVAPVSAWPAGCPGGPGGPGGSGGSGGSWCRGDRNKAHPRLGAASGRADPGAGLPTGRSTRMGLCARIARVARPVRRRVAECRRAFRLEKSDGRRAGEF